MTYIAAARFIKTWTILYATANSYN